MKCCLNKLCLSMIFVSILMCSNLHASVRGERYDVDVLCLLGVRDYCSMFEGLSDEFRFYSGGDFEIDNFPGSAGESDDFYLDFGLFVLAATSEQSSADEKLSASVYILNLLDQNLVGFMTIVYSENVNGSNVWVPLSTGFAVFWAYLDD